MNWDDYNKERVENLKDQVHITDILDYYGIKIHTKEREFQFPCPLHGDGQDNSYSARMYPESDSTYCFACHENRDVVQWVRDYEGLTFGKALSFIERTFGVSNIPKPTFDPTDEKTKHEVRDLLQRQRTAPTFLEKIRMMDRKARRAIRSEGVEVPWQMAAKIFYVLDNLRYDIQLGEVDDSKVANVLQKLYDQVKGWEETPITE